MKKVIYNFFLLIVFLKWVFCQAKLERKMPIVGSDLKQRLSIKTGTAGNQSAQPDGNQSLGKYISTTDVPSTLNGLYDAISGDENEAGTIDYRCVFVYNSHSTLTLQGAKLWLSGVRFTAANSGDLFTANSHGLVDGDAVRVEADRPSDVMPGGLSNSTTYYVITATTNTFQLSTTVGGSAVNVTSDGSGAARKYGNTTIALAIDNVAASAVGSASAQADSIANETTPPSAVGAFSSPTTKAGGLTLGDIGPGEVRAFWIRRTPLNAGARNSDGIYTQYEGDTAQ